MKRFSKSMLMAGGLTAAVIVWMLTGIGKDASPTQEPPRASVGSAANLPPRVSVQISRAQPITREIVVSARTEPNRAVELRAETDGRVVALGAERGNPVKSGERIVGLDIRDRQARLEQARATIAYAELQFEGARKLQQAQFVPETQIAEFLAQLVGARASLEEIELEVANTTLAAPFDAVLQERDVELGDYVNVGDVVAQLVDTDPLIVVGEIGERHVHEIAVGNTGLAKLVNGTPIEGTIRYVAPVANESTRTFRVELAVPNADGHLRAGMTAEMRLAADVVAVHFLSPALLSLDEAGTVGVKSVDDRDRVEFHPVEIVNSTDEGISVSGLPDEIRLITIGHGFVRPGDLVEPTIVPPSAGLTDASEAVPSPRAGTAQSGVWARP
jgi:multidrug efflux system membrane fusion protein